MTNDRIGIGVFSILFSVLAYFVYGNSISAMLGMFLLVIGSSLTTLLSLIPFIGVIIAYFTNTIYTYPAIMDFVGITPTWLTNLLLIFHTVLGVIITAITSYVVLKLRK